MLKSSFKGSRYSPMLYLTFRVEQQDDDEWPWCVMLVSVSPRGSGMLPDGAIPKDATVDCGHCGKDGPYPGRRICDACAVEEWIACTSAESWLESSHVKIDRDGLLHVNGCVEWPCHADGEERFLPACVRWAESPVHWLVEPEIESDWYTKDGDFVGGRRWEPGWYFYDETWANRLGPFDSEDEARAACKTYAEGL